MPSIGVVWDGTDILSYAGFILFYGGSVPYEVDNISFDPCIDWDFILHYWHSRSPVDELVIEESVYRFVQASNGLYTLKNNHLCYFQKKLSL